MELQSIIEIAKSHEQVSTSRLRCRIISGTHPRWFAANGRVRSTHWYGSRGSRAADGIFACSARPASAPLPPPTRSVCGFHARTKGRTHACKLLFLFLPFFGLIPRASERRPAGGDEYAKREMWNAHARAQRSVMKITPPEKERGWKIRR